MANDKIGMNHELHVFFVSNSTCCFFVNELYGLLSAAGYDQASLGLVYYSGCSIKQHNEWLKDAVSNYEFRMIDQNGMHIREHCSLDDALREKTGTSSALTTTQPPSLRAIRRRPLK